MLNLKQNIQRKRSILLCTKLPFIFTYFYALFFILKLNIFWSKKWGCLPDKVTFVSLGDSRIMSQIKNKFNSEFLWFITYDRDKVIRKYIGCYTKGDLCQMNDHLSKCQCVILPRNMFTCRCTHMLSLSLSPRTRTHTSRNRTLKHHACIRCVPTVYEFYISIRKWVSWRVCWHKRKEHASSDRTKLVIRPRFDWWTGFCLTF